MPNFNRKVSGVTATVRRLVPLQSKQIELVVFGDQVADLPSVQSRWRALYGVLRSNDTVVWHARRNTEMLLGVVLRWIKGDKLRLLFTSAAQRNHSAYTRWLIRQMDKIVAPCHASASYIPYREVEVIHHGVDLAEFHYTPRSPSASLTIAQVGRVRAQKGTDVLVDAVLPLLQQNTQLRLKLVGLITPEHQVFADEQRKKIESAGVETQVDWVDGLAWSELKALYASADLLVACPRNEGFGLTPLEAMASGAPVVVSEAGAFADMVDDGVHGRIVPIEDVSALREAIGWMLDDDARRAACAERAYERVQRQFDVEVEALRLVEVYRQLLDVN